MRQHPNANALLCAFNPSATRAFCERYSEFQSSDDNLSILGRIYALDANMYQRYCPAASGHKYPAPTLATINRLYGTGVSLAWIVVQLSSLAEFAGVKDKFTEEQLREQATLILSEYYYFRLSELMDFFRRFKLGYYGKFYGNADPLVVTEALRKFRDYRTKVIDQLEMERRQEEKQRERAEREHEAISYEQYKLRLAEQGRKPENEELIRNIVKH